MQFPCQTYKQMSIIKKIINCFAKYKANKLKTTIPIFLTIINQLPKNTIPSFNGTRQSSPIEMPKEPSSVGTNTSSKLVQRANEVSKANSYFEHIYLSLSSATLENTNESLIKKCINEKIRLLNLVQLELKKENKCSAVAQEVDAYVQHKLRCLNRGINVALPFPSYYHCTKEIYFDELVSSKQIKQTQAVAGFGAYVSTEIEHRDYGPYAFALEGSAIESLDAQYWTIGCSDDKRPFNSVWIRLSHNIPINPLTVAHVTVATLSERPMMQNRLTKLGLHVPILTREVSYHIDDLFQKIVPKRYFKKEWVNNNSPSDYFPKNIVEFKTYNHW